MPSPHHVLVVDRTGESAHDVAEILRSMPGRKVRCSTAESAESARAIGSESDDIVLLVVADQLPGAEGPELVAALGRLCPAAECIVIRGNRDLDSAVKAVGHGAFAYLVEPLLPATLLHSVEAALTKVELRRERDQLAAELRAAESRHRDLVDAIPGLLLGTDGDGRISSWNHALEELTGRSRTEMLGTEAKPIIGTGGDRRITTRDGHQRLLRWQLSESTGDGKQVTYALGTDVTEERANMRRTLRTERLAAVGTLATGLAHEIRNPLNSATLQLQVLRRRLGRDDRVGPTLVPILDTVDEEIRRLERLVGDFLAFARPHPLQLESVLVSQLFENVAEQLAPHLEKAGVSLHIERGFPEAPVEADRERLRQALSNLARNAVEAMPDGGRLTLRVRTADERGFVAVDVEDTGVGIAEHAPVFDAFFTTKPGGTGLGLAIVHRVVEDLGGSVQYESQPGATRFTLELPVSMQS